MDWTNEGHRESCHRHDSREPGFEIGAGTLACVSKSLVNSESVGYSMPRYLALVLAYLFLAIGMVGVVLPGLPTVPFLLLAAWFSARGSDRLHKWLYQHPHLGRLLIDWETHKAISRRSKVAAVLMLSVSGLIMWQRIDDIWVLSGITVLLAAVAIYLVSRREPG